jgi:RNA polymerase sigma-70 factor (ECF subfamily)
VKESGDEADLIQRSLAGDDRAFAGLVETHERVLYNLALRMVRDPEDARDLTQTVFIKAFRNLDRFDRRHRFFSWVYRIMMNEAINHIRARRPHEELDDRLLAPGDSPEQRVERAQVDERVRRAVMSLEEDHRDVIVLRHFLLRSHREMSALLGIPEKTVKSRLHTARQRLGEVLARQGIRST